VHFALYDPKLPGGKILVRVFGSCFVLEDRRDVRWAAGKGIRNRGGDQYDRKTETMMGFHIGLRKNEKSKQIYNKRSAMES
jgi:hypothetical protein